jgi:putative hydrolase of the HAD superfamily
MSSITTAVVFDLWRTLVPLTPAHRSAALSATAAALGCEHRDEFDSRWHSTRHLRETRPLLTYLGELRRSTRTTWTATQLEAAMAARRGAHYAAFSEVQPQVRDVLAELRGDGFRLGLVSNCTSDVRGMLQQSGLDQLFDTVVLSAEVGLMKPDPRIFALALRRLGVARGFYVGDGDDGELAGARADGLVDILLDIGDGRTGSHRIRRIEDLPELVKGNRL